jgi:hypothetical protein
LRLSCKFIKLWKICKIHAKTILIINKATPLVIRQVLEARGNFLIINQSQLMCI